MKRGVRPPRAVVRGYGGVLTCKVDVAPGCAENRLDLFPVQPNRLALPTKECQYRGTRTRGVDCRLTGPLFGLTKTLSRLCLCRAEKVRTASGSPS